MRTRALIPILILFSFPAGATELLGYVAFETRMFPNDGKFAGQSKDVQHSFVFEPEVFHISEDDGHIFTFKPFLRLDSVDSERTHFDIRDLSYLYQADDWELKIGISSVFWGVTESRHLVDIINQFDAIEDSDSEDKLGQSMIQYATFQDWGTLRLFYLPYARERTFPSSEGRLRNSMNVTSDEEYDTGANEWYPSFAIRYEKVHDDFDIGLSHFHGVSREPRLAMRATDLQPFYDVIDQTGIDLQYTTDAWLWKLEAINRFGHPGDAFQAATGGFEYTFYQIFDSDKDLGILAEYHYDNREATAPGTFFDDDVFLGARMTWNDADDTEILAGVVNDIENGQLLYSAEFATRVGDNWKIEADARFNSNLDLGTPENFLNKDDFVQLRVARYF